MINTLEITLFLAGWPLYLNLSVRYEKLPMEMTSAVFVNIHEILPAGF